MTIRLRQIALVAKDLDPVEKDITDQLGMEVCFRDPGVGAFGLHNALWAVGDKLLEVVSPKEDGTAAGRMLDRRGGDGGYMVILQTDDLDGARARFDEQNVRIVHTAQGEGIVGIHLHPKDVGGAIVSVDQADDWSEWGWAGPSWRDHVDTSVVTDLVGVSVQAEDPAAMAARWSAVLGVPVSGGDAPQLQLDEGVIRFVPVADGRGEGVSAIEVRAANGKPRESEFCGVRVQFVA